ncbi:MAG: Na(+)/H(+) antiporter subunit B [Alphaproteobacteria bacterium]
MKNNVIARVVAKLTIPGILLFALYVQFHGDYGPGGGFQAGVIFGAGFILYGMVFGLENLRKVVPPQVTTTAIAVGVLLYGGVGIVSELLGANYLDYSALAPDPHDGQHIGIIVVELGVGITVAAVMMTIFTAFAGRQR